LVAETVQGGKNGQNLMFLNSANLGFLAMTDRPTSLSLQN